MLYMGSFSLQNATELKENDNDNNKDNKQENSIKYLLLTQDQKATNLF